MRLFGIDIGVGTSISDKLFYLVYGLMTKAGFISWGCSPSPSPPAGPTNTTVTNTNIPDYAQPYVENMLNAAQAQIYNKCMTGFNPYVPYSTNPADYVASFSPLQQQAQSSSANLQTPGLYNCAAWSARNAQAGALGTAGVACQYGQAGSWAGNNAANLSNQYGAQGAAAGQYASGMSQQAGCYGKALGMTGSNIGQSLGQMSQNASTGPGSVASYMNPYLQQALAPQLQLANQQYGMTGAQLAGQATQQGAFGGSRQALQCSLNQQNKMLAQNQIIGQGYNQAFQNAQQQMNTANQAALAGNAQALQGAGMNLQAAGQAGSQAMQGAGMGLQAAGQAGNLGIQGAQAGLAGVGAQQNAFNLAGQQGMNLANIGSQQLGAQQSIIKCQAQQGALEQQNQQNIINQAVQNYATAQQYPYMQLGQLNAMLRGLPMQQSSTSMYQAAPSLAAQAGGLGVAALGASSLLGKKRGGVIKKMAVGGALPMNMMNQQQLSQVQQSPVSTPMAKMYAQGLQQTQAYDKANPEAAKVFSQPLQGNIQQGTGLPPPQQMANIPAPMQQGMAPQRTGVASIGTGNMTQMAGGGIIAFAGEGDSDVKDPSIPRTKSGELDLASILASRLSEEGTGKGTVASVTKPYMESGQAEIEKQKSQLMPEFFTRLGLGMMAAPAGQAGTGVQKLLSSVGQSGIGALSGMSSNQKDIQVAQKALNANAIEAAKADQARRDALTGTIAQVYGTEEAKKIGLANAAATRAAGADAKAAALQNAASTAYQQDVTRVFKELGAQEKNALLFQNHPEVLWQQAQAQVYNSMPQVTRDLLKLQAPVAAPAPGSAAPASGGKTPPPPPGFVPA